MAVDVEFLIEGIKIKLTIKISMLKKNQNYN